MLHDIVAEERVNYREVKVGFDCRCGRSISIGNIELGDDETLHGPISPTILGFSGECPYCKQAYTLTVSLLEGEEGVPS